MSAIKCIVINGNGNPITNEDGTAYIYDSIKEARAEIRANGYSYNRANDRYYFKAEDGTEYRAYILREGTPDYDYAIEKAEQDAAPEYISPEAIQTVAGQTIYRSTDPVTNEIVFTVSGRDFWTIAEARYFAQYNPVTAPTSDDATETAKESAEEAASLKDVDTYAHDAKSYANAAMWTLDRMTKDHPETAAELAHFARVCADHAKDAADKAAASYEHARRTCYADYQTSAYAAQALAIRAKQRDDAQQEAQRAEETAQKIEALVTVEDPQQREHYAAEAIAHQWSAEEIRVTVEYYAAITAANAAARALLDAYADVIGEYPHEDDDETHAAYKVARDEVTDTSARATEYDRAIVADMVETIAQAVADDMPTGPEVGDPLAKYRELDYLELDPPAPTYQRHELEAYLGEPQDYDVEAIEAEATAYDLATDSRIWTASGEDLARICERHQIATYYPAAV